MLQKNTGIVLHSLKYNENSLIIHMYTSLLGRTSYIIPISRSKKTALKSTIFQPLSIIEFDADYRPKGNIYKIKEAKNILPFVSIPYDPIKSSIAMFLAEFLYRIIREESENTPLFTYITHSMQWFDECKKGYANFHLVFLIRLTRFIGIFPNTDDYNEGHYFDLLNGGFTSQQPQSHNSYLNKADSKTFVTLMRMNYDNMHLFKMNREERNRLLTLIIDYYRLHIHEFTTIQSLEVLKELFD